MGYLAIRAIRIYLSVRNTLSGYLLNANITMQLYRYPIVVSIHIGIDRRTNLHQTLLRNREQSRCRYPHRTRRRRPWTPHDFSPFIFSYIKPILKLITTQSSKRVQLNRIGFQLIKYKKEKKQIFLCFGYRSHHQWPCLERNVSLKKKKKKRKTNNGNWFFITTLRKM